MTDQNGRTTSYAYDDADRLTSVTVAASYVTHYAGVYPEPSRRDTEGNLTSITDANSNQTAFTYDAFGRVTQTNFPSSLSENYQYDADNNLTQKIDRKNQTITYVYDALNPPAHCFGGQAGSPRRRTPTPRRSITSTTWWGRLRR